MAALARTIATMQRPVQPITTDRLVLRPLTPDDFDAFHAIVGRIDVNEFLYTSPRNEDEARRALAQIAERTGIDDEHDGLVLALTLPSGDLIGYVNLQITSREHEQGEIGYILHPDHQGHGYATEGTRVMLRLGFDELGLHRIAARLDARNRASARLLERLGMRREALLYENELVKDEWTSELIYAMLRDEWDAGVAGTDRQA